jgi:Flp pilus assembly protein TadD
MAPDILSASRFRALLRLLACAALLGLGVAGPAHAQLSTELDPKPQTPSAEVARLLREGRLDEALQRADAALKANPRDAQTRFLRGVILSDQKKPADAQAVFESLAQDFPELPEPLNNLAVLYAADGRYELARTTLHRAIAAQPNYVTAYENLGDLYVAMAADNYQRASQLDAKNRTAPAKLALARDLVTRLRAVR